MLDRDVAAIKPAQLAQALDQGTGLEHAKNVFRRPGRGRQITDAAHAFGLLRAARPRRDERRPGENDQIAPIHSSPSQDAAEARRAVTSISIFMRGSTRPQMIAVADGPTIGNAP